MSARSRPVPLLLAAALTAAEGLFLVCFALLEVAHLASSRLTMGVTTAIFFVLYGAGLLLCARGLGRCRSWARSPVVLAQLIQLGMAWSFRGGETTLIATVVAVSAVVVLVGVLHPASLAALSDAGEE